MGNIIEVEQSNQSALPVSQSPMRLVEMAIQSNADIEKLEKLMDLQDRWEAGNAKKQFLLAMAKFQSICPDIIKMKKAHNSNYAPLGDIVNQIREPLSSCGMSYRFEQDHTGGINVKCIVSHCDGHSESTQMSAPADSSGSKNGIQAIASTVTYLSRYTLTAALGIVTADADMDGRLPTDPMNVISDEQVQELIPLLCDESGHYTQKGTKVCQAFKFTNINEIKPKDFQKILKAAS